MPNNFWSGWLNEDPNAGWQTFRPQTGGYDFTNFWRGRQDQVYGDYLAKLGNMAMAGQAPDLSWTGFLQAYPFMQNYMNLSPSLRGERPTQGARWNIPW